MPSFFVNFDVIPDSMKCFKLFFFFLIAFFGSTVFAQDQEPLIDSVPKIPGSDYTDFLISDSLKRFYIVEDDSTYTYKMIVEDLDELLREHSSVLHAVTVGKSEFGLEMKTVRIGREVPKKDCVFLVGNIHAREDFSSKLLMKFLNVYLLSIDGKSNLYPLAAAMLDSVDIYIMPVANPDGLKIAQEDFEGITDSVNAYINSIYCLEDFPEWKANGKGIDLNRTFDDGNFAVKKGGGFQPKPASEGYKGAYPAQPVETQNIQKFLALTEPLVTASFHTKGNILFWADAQTHPFLGTIDTKIIDKIAAASGFKVATIAKYASEYGCGLENYVRSKHGLIGTCVELSSGDRTRQQHADDQFNVQVWKLAWNIPWIFIENAALYNKEIRANSEAYLILNF